MKNVTMIPIKMFGVHSTALLAVLCSGCNISGQENIIPYGIYISQNGNVRLNFRDQSHLTMEYPTFEKETQYWLVQKEDTKEIQIVFESGNDTLSAEYYIEDDNSIYLMYFKMKDDISHHIDEIGRFYSNDENRKKPVNCSTIILDSIQTGEYFVHFENTLSITNHNCDTIYITRPGLSRVMGNMDLRNLEQIQILSVQGQIIDSLPFPDGNAYYDINILGFNQADRTHIENELNERLSGDVFMFHINKRTHSDR